MPDRVYTASIGSSFPRATKVCSIGKTGDTLASPNIFYVAIKLRDGDDLYNGAGSFTSTLRLMKTSGSDGVLPTFVGVTTDAAFISYYITSGTYTVRQSNEFGLNTPYVFDTTQYEQLNGKLQLDGQLVLKSSISDGTNAFTLPSSSGKLALESQIPSLPGHSSNVIYNQVVARDALYATVLCHLKSYNETGDGTATYGGDIYTFPDTSGKLALESQIPSICSIDFSQGSHPGYNSISIPNGVITALAWPCVSVENNGAGSYAYTITNNKTDSFTINTAGVYDISFVGDYYTTSALMNSAVFNTTPTIEIDVNGSSIRTEYLINLLNNVTLSGTINIRVIKSIAAQSVITLRMMQSNSTSIAVPLYTRIYVHAIKLG